jgi:HAD superfamily hydrolase (TIGR01509 family)
LSSTPPALIFDCDGVLVDSEYLASRVESELTRELGLELTVEEAHDLFLGRTVDGVLDAIAGRTGKRPSSAFTYNWAFATAHAFKTELGPVPGVRGALEELVRRGHRLAVASQSPLARVRFSLDVTGLGAFFGAHVYVTSMVPRPKPAPDIYLHAAGGLATPPAGCVVIEDSPAGAAAARAAGFGVIGYAPGDTFAVMQATGVAVIRSMDELLDRIDAAPSPTAHAG